jgi:hypothetical protein
MTTINEEDIKKSPRVALMLIKEMESKAKLQEDIIALQEKLLQKMKG